MENCQQNVIPFRIVNVKARRQCCKHMNEVGINNACCRPVCITDSAEQKRNKFFVSLVCRFGAKSQGIGFCCQMNLSLWCSLRVSSLLSPFPRDFSWLLQTMFLSYFAFGFTLLCLQNARTEKNESGA